MDTSIGRKLTNAQDYASIFSKVIDCELTYGSIADLYLRCWMGFANNVVLTKAPQLMDLGILSINTWYELGILGTPATMIIRPTDGYHGWKLPGNYPVFTVVMVIYH